MDVVFSGDMTTKGDHPLRFRGTTGRLRVGLEFDAPLTRLVERNDYREALINYQQARRSYYAYEDLVNQNLRATLRVMSQDQLDFEIQRMAVHIAADRVNQAWLALNEPPRPGEQGSSNLGPTAARDLVDALSGLLDTQDTILNIWVENESRRMTLDLNLGTMRLDDRGMWVDPAEIPFDEDNTGQGMIDTPEEIATPQPLPNEAAATPSPASNAADKLSSGWRFLGPPAVEAAE